ncbi:MAG: cbb3-type cytochrome oxidase assembly protein CcoS [Magnetococcus sp. YQC-3]
MDSVYLLLPLAVLLGLIALSFLLWSVRHGQFDDMEGPAHRILFEEDQALLPTYTPPPPDDPPAEEESPPPTPPSLKTPTSRPGDDRPS